MLHFIVTRLTMVAGHGLNWVCLLKPSPVHKSGKWFGHVNWGLFRFLKGLTAAMSVAAI